MALMRYLKAWQAPGLENSGFFLQNILIKLTAKIVLQIVNYILNIYFHNIKPKEK